MPTTENQQFVTKPPEVGDTFMFRGIKLVVAPLIEGQPCTGCYGRWQSFCRDLPRCEGVVWKNAADQRNDQADLDNKEQGWN